MLWNVCLLAIILASSGFRIYCEFHEENKKLKVLQPIINTIAMLFGYLVIVPKLFKLSLYNIYIKPDFILYYAIDVTLVAVVISNIISLIKEIKKNK